MRRLVPGPFRRAMRGAVVQVEDRRAGQAFARARPDLSARVASGIPDAQRALSARHAAYVATVSTTVAAVSLETAALLQVLCETLEVDTALDLGSGFSTWVLAGSTHVTSVDDSEQWRLATERFLGPVAAEVDLVRLDQVDRIGSSFDLVFHDLGSMVTRATWLPWALDRAVKACVLDDVHKPPYRATVEQELAGRRGTLWKAGGPTRDGFGREAWVWFPEPST